METQKKDESGILFLENAEGELCLYKTVRKVHENNCQKKKERLISVYRNAEWRSPDIMDTITRVVNDCMVCQKFKKSLATPRVILP